MGIFKTHGYLQAVPVPDWPDTAFITLADDLRTVINGSAPLTGVDIKMATDATISKALNKDFLITAFGDQPVYITITGLQITWSPCENGLNAKSSVLNFYMQNKISVSAEKRVDVGIAAGGDAQAFTCALLNMEVQADTKGSEYGYCTYKVTLVGVAKGKQ
jgi:hypothetical protein